MRSYHANLNLDVEKGGVAQVLCPNVTKLEFSYYDSRYKKWEESWVADPTLLVGGGLDEAAKNGEKDKNTRCPSSGACLVS